MQTHRFAKANSRTNRKTPIKHEKAGKKKKLAEAYTNIWSYKVKERNKSLQKTDETGDERWTKISEYEVGWRIQQLRK